jgi:hypothetical protein
MNDKDKEAFDKWFIKTYRYDYKDLVIPKSVNPQKEAWQAAIEYERFNHKYCVVGSLDKLCEKLEAENKKLREALEFYADTSNPNSIFNPDHDEEEDCEFIESTQFTHFGKRAREALKEEE